MWRSAERLQGKAKVLPRQTSPWGSRPRVCLQYFLPLSIIILAASTWILTRLEMSSPFLGLSLKHLSVDSLVWNGDLTLPVSHPSTSTLCKWVCFRECLLYGGGTHTLYPEPIWSVHLSLFKVHSELCDHHHDRLWCLSCSHKGPRYLWL